MNSFLTLAVAQEDPAKNNYFVIAMDMNNKNIYKFNLDKKEIISNKGEVYWDIGFITTVENIEVDRINKNIRVGKFLNITNKIGNLKSILDAKAANPQEFFLKENIEFGVAKVKKILDLEMGIDYENNNVFKSSMKLKIMYMPVGYDENILLNHDYRWIKYWERTYNKSDFIDKKNKYIKMLNNPNKSLYLVLFRMKFSDSKTNKWIVGMHWV